jgi:2-oxoisovalerate dehydrogenase E1 component
MTKSLFVDPVEVRKSGWLSFENIPLNQYNKTLEEEKGNFSKEDLLGIFRDMSIIREFETALYTLKTEKEYAGVKYDYTGPAHLSIGQEASAVG